VRSPSPAPTTPASRSPRVSHSSSLRSSSDADSSIRSAASFDGHVMMGDHRLTYIDGLSLRDFRNITIDPCALTLSVLSPRAARLNTDLLCRLLRAERIRYRRLHREHVHYATTVRLKDEGGLRKFLCYTRIYQRD